MALARSELHFPECGILSHKAKCIVRLLAGAALVSWLSYAPTAPYLPPFYHCRSFAPYLPSLSCAHRRRIDHMTALYDWAD
ncbi:hypothetical protein DMN91_005177 [Ooceraea biroi]|uniref:Uncharacterized protein n=1 Tax=Ooceraea biroi TaxID=2015173 RepID=A0A3L8DSP6_OOCBI|nr:hypothetical protein DMN91_005177 [Ooceraea biroi]